MCSVRIPIHHSHRIVTVYGYSFIGNNITTRWSSVHLNHQNLGCKWVIGFGAYATDPGHLHYLPRYQLLWLHKGQLRTRSSSLIANGLIRSKRARTINNSTKPQVTVVEWLSAPLLGNSIISSLSLAGIALPQPMFLGFESPSTIFFVSMFIKHYYRQVMFYVTCNVLLGKRTRKGPFCSFEFEPRWDHSKPFALSFHIGHKTIFIVPIPRCTFSERIFL